MTTSVQATAVVSGRPVLKTAGLNNSKPFNSITPINSSQSLPTLATVNHLQSLGLISNQQSSIASTNNNISPAVEDAFKSIAKNLDEKGIFNDVTHSELLSINKTLANLTPKQTNEAISQLSDENLKIWTSEISSSGILGTGGLKSREKTSFLKNVIADLNTDQLARVSNASDNKDFRQEMVGLISDKTNATAVSAAIDDRLSNSPNQNNKALVRSQQQLNEIQDATFMARLSADSYKDFAQHDPGTIPKNIKRLGSDRQLSSLGLSSKDLNDLDSGFASAVYEVKNGKDSEYVVAFRGTEDGTDWKTNLASLGDLTKQHNMASKLVKTIVDNKGISYVGVTGHSLGAGLSNYAAVKHGIQSTGFNSKGVTLPELLDTKDYLGFRGNQLIKNYQVKGEALTLTQENITIALEPHGEKQKIPAIRKDDGSEGNMFTETVKEIALSSIPVFGPGMAKKHDISGPIDRHGMAYVERGMNKILENKKKEAINLLLESYKP